MKRNKDKEILNLILGIVFFASGIFQVITHRYSEVAIIILSILAFMYCLFREEYY